MAVVVVVILWVVGVDGCDGGGIVYNSSGVVFWTMML